jgi:hypothetical protein
MASSFSFPFDCWMGLQVAGFEVSGAGYTRRPAHYVDIGDGLAANAFTVEWGACGTDWGWVDTVNLYDALTGGDLVGTGLVTTPLYAARYDELRVPAGGYQVYSAVRPIGFGTLGFGTGKYATFHYLTPPGSGLGSPYGTEPYGAGPYEALEVPVLLLRTFGTVALCGGKPSTWAPGPFDVVTA